VRGELIGKDDALPKDIKNVKGVTIVARDASIEGCTMGHVVGPRHIGISNGLKLRLKELLTFFGTIAASMIIGTSFSTGKHDIVSPDCTDGKV